MMMPSTRMVLAMTLIDSSLIRHFQPAFERASAEAMVGRTESRRWRHPDCSQFVATKLAWVAEENHWRLTRRGLPRRAFPRPISFVAPLADVAIVSSVYRSLSDPEVFSFPLGFWQVFDGFPRKVGWFGTVASAAAFAVRLESGSNFAFEASLSAA